MAGLVRTHRLALEASLPPEITATSPLFPHLVKYVVWAYNRYQLRRVGVTPVEQVNHRTYRNQVLPFAQP
eukprot:7189065-Heterocapsa_arctica.AAC.1